MNTIVRLVSVASLGCVGLASAVPAVANEKLPGSVYKAKYDAKRDQYCLKATGNAGLRTGTRIPLVECKTQAEWAVEGLKVARN